MRVALLSLFLSAACTLCVACAPRTAAVPTAATVPAVATAALGGAGSPRAAARDTAWRASSTGATPVLQRIEGVRSEPGPFREYYRTPATTSLPAHRHTADMHIRVLEGRQFILMGPDLETARVQHFDAGVTFVIPAGTWHVEWFEVDTLVEISGIGPMRTERASPETPRVE